MTTATFNRDALAKFYATQHLKTDDGIRTVFYLPNNSPEREIRLIEVNELIAERGPRELVPIDFGIDRGMPSEHFLYVVDVTPEEWQSIQNNELSLPPGWELDERKSFGLASGHE